MWKEERADKCRILLCIITPKLIFTELSRQDPVKELSTITWWRKHSTGKLKMCVYHNVLLNQITFERKEGYWKSLLLIFSISYVLYNYSFAYHISNKKWHKMLTNMLLPSIEKVKLLCITTILLFILYTGILPICMTPLFHMVANHSRLVHFTTRLAYKFC